MNVTETYNLALVIPCYNEEFRLDVDEFQRFSRSNPDIFLFLVDDGSRDKTLDVISNLAVQNEAIDFLSLKPNKGKAEAVRQGLLHVYHNTKAPLLGYFDADLATPLETSRELAEYITKENSTIDMAIGSRVKKLGSDIRRKWKRHFLGRVIATLISYILRLPVYDSQCGAKLFKRELVPGLFEKPFKTKWLFDVEMISRLLLMPAYHDRVPVYELPLHKWTHIDNSKIKFRDFFRIPIDLLRIFFTYHYKIKKYRKR